MISALELDSSQNLSGFSTVLGQYGIRHRISESSGRQVVWVAQQADVAQVQHVYQQFQNGQYDEVLKTVTKPAQQNGEATRWLLLLEFSRSPVTLLLVLVCLVVALITQLGDQLAIVGLFTFLEVTHIQQDMLLSMPDGQPWRMITPVFIHFSVLHIAFNMLWLWELGRRIEQSQGSLAVLFLVFVIGLASNIAQAIAVKGGFFGGMSGVIYGLLGYCWLWNLLRPKEAFAINKGVVFFLLLWLALGYSGVITLLGFGAIANTAHASGLVAGLVIAVVFVALTKTLEIFRK
ncbi:MAG: rhomboid family intramembrane serine protease [Pseudomonadales bacterium]|nr:rhomboid family intramembrane serine protease [Pseudomonadales bacterium]